MSCSGIQSFLFGVILKTAGIVVQYTFWQFLTPLSSIFVRNPGKELLKPIVTSSGVHLILVEEIIQPQLDNRLRYQIMSELFSQWLKQEVEEVETVTNLEFNTQTV